MQNTNPIPVSDWPWWVRFIATPMYSLINPKNNIRIVTYVLLVLSVLIAAQSKIIYGNSLYPKIFLICVLEISVMSLWQALATLWVNENSSWDLLEAGLLKKIFSGVILLLILFGAPILLLLTLN